jgi:predicted lactoylglutathione lyase
MKQLTLTGILIFIFFSFDVSAQNSTGEKEKTLMKAIIHTPTNKIENSYSFYEKLGFKVTSKEIPLIVTDGKAIIEVNPDRFARAGIKLFKKSWAQEVPQLKELTALINLPNGFLFYDPSGIAIYLIESDFNFPFVVADSSFSDLGNFAGLTLETADIKKSFTIYEILGFEKNMGAAEKGFVGLIGGDNFNIVLMSPLQSPHLFYNPSLTYFNGKKNLAVIKKIRELNIPIIEEISTFNKEGIVDNIIIKDPGGYGFFIFSD